MRQGAPAIGAGAYGAAPAWGAPFPPPRPVAGGRRTYAFLIVAGALAVVVVLFALVTVAVPFVRTEIRRYMVPSNGLVQPVPSTLGPSDSLLTRSITTAVVNEEWTVFANAGSYAGLPTSPIISARPTRMTRTQACKLQPHWCSRHLSDVIWPTRAGRLFVGDRDGRVRTMRRPADDRLCICDRAHGQYLFFYRCTNWLKTRLVRWATSPPCYGSRPWGRPLDGRIGARI